MKGWLVPAFKDSVLIRNFLSAMLAVIATLPWPSYGRSGAFTEPFYTVYTGDCHIPIPIDMSLDFAADSFYVASSDWLNDGFDTLEEANRNNRMMQFFRDSKTPAVLIRGKIIEPEVLTEKAGFRLVKWELTDSQVYYITSERSSVKFAFYSFDLNFASFAFDYCTANKERMLSSR